MFEPIDYLEWISGRPQEASVDFGSSDLGEHEYGVVPDRLLDLPDPSDDRPLERLIADQYGSRVEPANVLVTAGAAHANFLATAATLDSPAPAGSASVLVERPTYEPLVRTPSSLGASVSRFERDPAAQYALDPGAVEESVGSETALVTVTNRHNPSGRLTDAETLRSLSELGTGTDTSILVDEVYAPFVDDPLEANGAAFGGPTAAGLPSVVVTSSLTKFHGLGDLRVGWLIASEAIVERARSVAWHFPVVAGPSRRLARRALYNVDALEETSRSRLHRNHDHLRLFVDARSDLDGFVAPGSTFAFLSHGTASGETVCETAWDDGVLLVPGRFFETPSHFRVSLATPSAHCEDGLAALERILDRL